MDIRRWRNSIGLYQKELAKFLNVDVGTLVRAEQSATPSSRLIYGTELLRKKIDDGELAIYTLKKGRARRGRPKKQDKIIRKTHMSYCVSATIALKPFPWWTGPHI